MHLVGLLISTYSKEMLADSLKELNKTVGPYRQTSPES